MALPVIAGMSGAIRLFVVDTGPLITLAVAGSLDYLFLVSGVPVVIPDAVFYEATRDASRLGAADILARAKDNAERVTLAPTNAYVVFATALEVNPGLRQSNLGEQAAVEVIEEPGRLGPGERTILLCEESAVLRRVRVLDAERVVELSTLDFLRLLEAERRIQSAEAVFERAIEGGRTPSRAGYLARHEAEVRDTIAALLRRDR